MYTQEIIGVLILLNTLACLLIQGRGIIKGKYDSSLASWIIWSSIFIFLFVIYFIQEGWNTVCIFLLIQTIAHLFMIPITYRYVEKQFSAEEGILLGMAVLGFGIWGISYYLAYWHDGSLLLAVIVGILGQIMADAAGAISYIKIVINKPFRQPLSAWIINSFVYPLVGYGIYLNNETWTGYLFIGYAFIMYTTLLFILIRQRRKKMKTSLQMPPRYMKIK